MKITSFRIGVNKDRENIKIRQTWGLATLLLVLLISAAAQAASPPIDF
jgi:hypothetical protein